MTALASGTTTDKIFDMVKRIRPQIKAALAVMTYMNPIFVYGTDAVSYTHLDVYKRQGLSYEKMAASVDMLFPGNPFIYYGEEIGITAPNTTSDSAYRTPMIFDSNNFPNIWVRCV